MFSIFTKTNYTNNPQLALFLFETLSVSTKILSSKEEKIINNIIATKDCWNNKDKTVLSQVLKNQEVDSFIKLNIANGVIKINTFTIIYLKEYEKIKLNKLIEIKLFINPSKEKILNSFSLIEK